LSVVRVLDGAGTAVGAGFLVAPDVVATCAHVVNTALDRDPADDRTPPGPVRVDFPMARERGAPPIVAAQITRWSLVSYARRHGVTGPAAEDVVQQAFENVWQRRLRPTEITNVDAYVQTAVRHETWRTLRRASDDRERYAGDPADYVPSRDGGPADLVADRVTLHRFLGRLPAREREAVVLRMVWDLSVREAAETMGLSEGAVKRYCSDGLHRLNAWLSAA
jgi:RNA polymerase sigma factor (sigma-70 family)